MISDPRYESTWMKFAYFIFHPGSNPPPQNGCRSKSIDFFKSTGFTSSTFPIPPDFSQNQPAANTLNTGSPRTLYQFSQDLTGCKLVAIHLDRPIS